MKTPLNCYPFVSPKIPKSFESIGNIASFEVVWRSRLDFLDSTVFPSRIKHLAEPLKTAAEGIKQPHTVALLLPETARAGITLSLFFHSIVPFPKASGGAFLYGAYQF